nr:MAG TPA: hypothetical protein [Caudoviricetes sp.]
MLGIQPSSFCPFSRDWLKGLFYCDRNSGDFSWVQRVDW